MKKKKRNDFIFSVYHQYHREITKRVAPKLREIAKKRKKKEQADLANATKLAEIQEINVIEKENDRKIPPPSSNRISSPLPDIVNKQSNQIPKIQSLPTKGIRILIFLSRLTIFFSSSRDNSIKRRFN